MRRFEFVDVASRKFWEIEIRERATFVRYGAIGTKGQEKLKPFPSQEDAQREIDRLVREKMKKGYVECAPGSSLPPPIEPFARLREKEPLEEIRRMLEGILLRDEEAVTWSDVSWNAETSADIWEELDLYADERATLAESFFDRIGFRVPKSLLQFVRGVGLPDVWKDVFGRTTSPLVVQWLEGDFQNCVTYGMPAELYFPRWELEYAQAPEHSWLLVDNPGDATSWALLGLSDHCTSNNECLWLYLEYESNGISCIPIGSTFLEAVMALLLNLPSALMGSDAKRDAFVKSLSSQPRATQQTAAELVSGIFELAQQDSKIDYPPMQRSSSSARKNVEMLRNKLRASFPHLAEAGLPFGRGASKLTLNLPAT